MEPSWDARFREQFDAGGVRYQPLSRESHWAVEQEWRKIYIRAFDGGSRCRQGAKAVHAYLNEPSAAWVLIPFLARVPGLPVLVRPHLCGGFECHGRLLELDGFGAVEFFVSPTDLAWTFVRTHEDWALGGPYFLRKEWIVGANLPSGL